MNWELWILKLFLGAPPSHGEDNRAKGFFSPPKLIQFVVYYFIIFQPDITSIQMEPGLILQKIQSYSSGPPGENLSRCSFNSLTFRQAALLLLQLMCRILSLHIVYFHAIRDGYRADPRSLVGMRIEGIKLVPLSPYPIQCDISNIFCSNISSLVRVVIGKFMKGGKSSVRKTHSYSDNMYNIIGNLWMG